MPVLRLVSALPPGVLSDALVFWAMSGGPSKDWAGFTQGNHHDRQKLLFGNAPAGASGRPSRWSKVAVRARTRRDARHSPAPTPRFRLRITSMPPDDAVPQQAPAAARAKPALTGPKRQHFLPRFYLHNFSTDGLVAVYDREKDEVRLQQPENTGVIGHFYTMEDAEGRRRYELEQLLAEYEGKAKPVIDKLAAQEPVDADERTDLAIFIALGTTRTPDVVDSLKAFNAGVVTDVMKRLFDDVDDVAARLREDPDFADKTEDALFAEAKLMVDMAQNDGMKVMTEHRWAVGMAIQLALEIAPILADRDWVVLHCENDKKSFVTTDAPVFLTTMAPRANKFWGVGFGNADALVFFPLKESCTLAMFGNSGDLRHAEASTEKVRQLNLGMAARCQRFVIGRDEALVRSLAQAARLAQTKWKPKMQRS